MDGIRRLRKSWYFEGGVKKGCTANLRIFRFGYDVIISNLNRQEKKEKKTHTQQ